MASTSIYFLLSLSLLIVPLLLVSTVLIAIYRTKRYTQSPIPQDFTPHCSIILPCKGANPNLYQNIKSFLELDYPNYSLSIVVESEADTAVPLIQKAIQGHRKASLVIAGITTTCGQKNHNLIETVKTLSPTDILVFADSDIQLSPTWIQELIAPLQNQKITVTTGFRWLSPGDTTIGSFVHSFQNLILYSFFSTSSWLTNMGIWGGSMAVRYPDYQRLQIEKVWAKTSVDDMSLAEILKKKKARTQFVYSAVTYTTDTLTTIPQTLDWYERQTMYLKAHQKFEWITSMLIVFSTLTAYGVGFIALILLGLGQSPQIAQELLITFGLFLGGIYLSASLAPLIGPINYVKRFILLAPISLLITVLSMVRTLFTNTIIWSGVSYKLRFKDGTVTKVSRGDIS